LYVEIAFMSLRTRPDLVHLVKPSGLGLLAGTPLLTLYSVWMDPLVYRLAHPCSPFKPVWMNPLVYRLAHPCSLFTVCGWIPWFVGWHTLAHSLTCVDGSLGLSAGTPLLTL